MVAGRFSFRLLTFLSYPSLLIQINFDFHIFKHQWLQTKLKIACDLIKSSALFEFPTLIILAQAKTQNIF